MLFAGLSWAKDPPNLTLPEFRTAFENSFTKNDFPALKKVAGEQPEKLRILFIDLLSEYSLATAESRVDDAENLSTLAAAVAVISQELFDDPFLSHQLRLYQGWNRNEHFAKVKADVYLRKAKAAFDEGRYGDVISPGESALKLYSAINDAIGRGTTLHYLGQAQRRLVDYAAALLWHHQALEQAAQVGDSLNRGRAFIDIGDIHERKKEMATAIAFYEDALQTLKSPACWQEASRALRQLGDVYVATGDFEKAYRSYNQALQHAERAKDSRYIAECNDYIGFCHRSLGDYRMAMKYHQEALETAEKIVSNTDRLRARARSLNHLGICFSRIAEEYVTEGDPAEAIKKYREAISTTEQALDVATQVQDRWRQGYLLRALSGMHRELGVLYSGEEALQEFDKALGRAEESFALGRQMKEKEWQGHGLHSKALALLLLNRDRESRKAFQQALDLWEQMGDLQAAGYAHQFLARNFHEAKGRLADAETSYDRAINAFEKIGDSESNGFAMLDKARVQALQGKKKSAAALYDKGIAKLETVRSKAGFPEFRKAFMGKIYDRYEEAALFAIDNGFKDRALLYVESMKARVFLDQLAEGRVAVEKGIDPELKAKRDQLEKDIAGTTNKLSEEFRKASPDDEVIAATRAKIDHLSVELDRLIKQIRFQNPLYASVNYPFPVTVAELQSKVLTQDEVLLEYFISKRGLFCFIVTTEDFEIVQLSENVADLYSDVLDILDNISALSMGLAYDRILASRLFDILIKPLEKSIEGKTLVIVPDGVLAMFPFEALIIVEEGKRSYLLEKYVVKYIQSASVLALVRKHRDSPQTSRQFIGFGDPVYDYENFRKGTEETDASIVGRGLGTAKTRYAWLGGPLNRLEASGDEIRAINQIFQTKKIKTKIYLREKARKDFAKAADMNRYGYLHFSMHGIVTPQLQAVVFSQIPDAGDDGLLTVNEIMNLQYNARLVVLSACQTGLGPLERGEGVTGLTRAVMYAGSPATAVSLWNVDDTGTRELMTRLYENIIQKDMDNAEALHKAKQDMLKNKYRHPYFWSAFVMYGD